MTTKHRFRNKYRLQLREKDHNPMHVHIVGGDVNATIDLDTLQIVEGFVSSKLYNEIVEWLSKNRSKLIEEWQTWQ